MPPVRDALTICALFVLTVGVATATADNSNSAKQCHKNGWQGLYTSTGVSFESKLHFYNAASLAMRQGHEVHVSVPARNEGKADSTN